jgi:hypothetical protein
MKNERMQSCSFKNALQAASPFNDNFITIDIFAIAKRPCNFREPNKNKKSIIVCLSHGRLPMFYIT